MSCPARFLFCFAHPFEYVIGDAHDKIWRWTSVRSSIGPRAYQRLVEKIFIARIGGLGSPDDGFLLPIKLAPDSQLMVPGKWDFREHVDSRATSSDRFESCVEVATISCGTSRARA